MMKEKKRKREPITETRELDILEIINSWNAVTHKFTREALTRRVTCQLGFAVTRQGLMKRPKIKDAFEAREREFNAGMPVRAPKEALEEMYERRHNEMKAKLDSANNTISNFKELFVRYRYNARQLGIRGDQLEAPIPPRDAAEGSRG